MASAVRAADNHWVHFYDDDDVLCEAVSRFLKDGLDASQPALVIATEAHRNELSRLLGLAGVDVDQRVARGEIVMADAREMLARCMKDGRVNAASFEQTIGGVLQRTLANDGQASVRAYGEMVDLLCRDGQTDAALELEDLWNRLAQAHEFSLFCAYVMDSFAGHDDAKVAAIGAVHAKTLKPGEPVVLAKRPHRPHLRAIAEAKQWNDAESFRKLVDTVTDYAIFMLDPRGIVRTWNRGAERIKGYHADEIIGHHFSRFYPSEDVANGTCDQILQQATRDERVERQGWRVRKDGTRFWANVVLTALRNADGELVGFAKVTRDLTERMQAEEERVRLVELAAAHRAAEHMAQLLARLHRVAGSLGAARTPSEIAKIVVTEGKEALGAASASFARPAEGGQLELVDSFGIPDAIAEHFQRFPADGRTPAGLAYVEAEAQWFEDPNAVVQRFPGSRPGALAMLPLVLGRQVLGVIGYRFDGPRQFGADERALMETMATQAAQALDRANAYAAAEDANRVKDEFLATVSHELRTPLTSIFGWASILKGTTDLAMIAKGLETIHRNAKAQIKLIDDLLDISRIVSGKLALDRDRVDVALLVHDALEVVRPSAKAKNLALMVEGCDEPAYVDGDDARLQQVVLNLLSNAVKFTDADGTVTISVARAPGTIDVCVRDTGRGIRPEFLPHVFERFRQGDAGPSRRTGGLGLGLAISKHIATLHGGNIAVSSEGVGKGAAFTVTLPALDV